MSGQQIFAFKDCFGIISPRVEFEYDLDKSESNKRKHGIDFEESKALWNDLSAYEVDAITIDEPRTKRVGNCQGKLWAAIFTMREERIRIISVRRAHGDEAKRYQND